MRDILLDIIRHTGDTGLVSSVLVTGDDEKTVISGIADDRTAVIEAVLKEPNPNFVGKFGMTNLSLLKFYLNYGAYKGENSDIRTKTDERNGQTVITDIIFSDESGDNTSTYRVADHRHVPPKAELMVKKWEFDFTPDPAKVKEFEALGNGLGSLEKQFMPMTDDKGNLRFHIGDINAATHKANMVVLKDTETKFKQGSYFLTKSVVTALKLGSVDGATTNIKLAETVLQVTVDTALATYKFMFPAMPRASK